MGSAASELPLSGIRVLDLTTWWAGPLNAMILADFGAEVIKIEAIQRLDNWRATLADRNFAQWWETSPLFNSTQRNKYGITLNLAAERGVELFKALVERSDVVCENYSPRVMPQLGLDYEILVQVNPLGHDLANRFWFDRPLARLRFVCAGCRNLGRPRASNRQRGRPTHLRRSDAG